MKRHRTVIIIALIGIIPMICAVFALKFIMPSDQAEQTQAAAPAQEVSPAPVEEPKLRTVYAAARELPVGTLLGEEDLTPLGFEEQALPRGHIAVDEPTAIPKPRGHVVREAIADGAPLTWQALVGPHQRGFLAAVLGPGMRAVTIRLGAGTRQSGLIDPGDRVDVVLTTNSRDGGTHGVLSRRILEDVRVLAVDHRIGSHAGPENDARKVERGEIVTATLEVLPEQTGLLALGDFEGELTLAVRPLAAAGAPTQRNDSVNLNDLLAQPAVAPTEPETELSTTVRVIRGTDVTGEVFGGSDAESTVPLDSAMVGAEL